MTEKEIVTWLDQYGVEGYTLVPDPEYGFIVDVLGDVDLHAKNLDYIPVKFNVVSGNFNCSHNHLTILKNCPEEVQGFHCGYNRLTTLEFSPKIVTHYFYCHDNLLTTLKGAPQSVGERFHCSNNQLLNLEFCPKFVGESFYCHCNKLNTMEYIPDSISGEFWCKINPELGDYQGIEIFADIKKISNIYKEQKLLDNAILKSIQAKVQKI